MGDSGEGRIDPLPNRLGFCMEFLGWVGTVLVLVAYLPQIYHLYAYRCAWGISVSTWSIWLAASTCLFAYALLQGEILFAIVQTISILAIAATLVLIRRSGPSCPIHFGKRSGHYKDTSTPAGS
jgi:uncharacterized protein with PQ loop repeat